jgi:hypothetical protein
LLELKPKWRIQINLIEVDHYLSMPIGKIAINKERVVYLELVCLCILMKAA